MRRYLLALAVLTLAACAKKDDSETLRKAVASWSATLQFVADARLRDEVSSRFAVKTAEAAVEELSVDVSKPSLPQPLALSAERVIGAGARLRRAFQNDDRAAIAAARGELASAPAGLP